MNANQVVIVMDRGTADYLRLVGNDKNSPEFFSDCYQGEVMPAVEAALDRDPAELEEQVTRKVWDAIPGPPEPPSGPMAHFNYADTQAAVRAILHALQEGTENE